MHDERERLEHRHREEPGREDVAEPGDRPEQGEETGRDEVERDRERQEQDDPSDGARRPGRPAAGRAACPAALVPWSSGAACIADPKLTEPRPGRLTKIP